MTMIQKILMKQFSRYEVAMDIFCEAITDLPHVPGETAEPLSERLESLLREKFGGAKNEN